MSDLKPCPFCGNKVVFNHNIELEPDGIWCVHCRMLVRYSRIHVKPGEKFRLCEERLAEAWNRRVSDE